MHTTIKPRGTRCARCHVKDATSIVRYTFDGTTRVEYVCVEHADLLVYHAWSRGVDATVSGINQQEGT